MEMHTLRGPRSQVLHVINGLGAFLSFPSGVRAVATTVALLCLCLPSLASDRRGSGFFVTQQGHIVTAYHVIKDSAQIRIHVFNKRIVYWASVLGVDPQRDIALLSIDIASPAALGFSERSNSAPTTLVALGYPSPLQGPTLLSAVPVDRPRQSLNENAPFFRFAGVLGPGQSGGPVVASDGSLVGMVIGRHKALTAKNQEHSQEALNVALSAQAIRKFIEAQIGPLPGSTPLPPDHVRYKSSIGGDSVSRARQAVVLVSVRESSERRATQTEGERIEPDREQSAKDSGEIREMVQGLIQKGYRFPARTSVGHLLVRTSPLPVIGPDNQVAQGAELVVSLQKPREDAQGRSYQSSLSELAFDCVNQKLLITSRETFTGQFLSGDTVDRQMQRNPRWAETPTPALNQYLLESLCK